MSGEEMTQAGPLGGVRVLDASEGAQGPWAGALLGDLGAEVIKLERPEGEMQRYYGPYKHGMPLPLLGLNRNKKGLVLDLKQPEDRQKAYTLLKWCDVFIENFRPGVMERLGFDYQTLSRINSRLIYCSASGFGQEGPYKHKPCIDPIAQAVGGLASVTGPEGGPAERARFVAADMTSPLVLCQAILVALYGREFTGQGQYIQTCQLDSTIALQAGKIAEYFATGLPPTPMGSATSNMVPSQAFMTRDGQYITVSAPTDEFWQKLCRAIGKPELLADQRFRSNRMRVEHRRALVEVLEQVFRAKEAEEWLRILTAADVPCGHVCWDLAGLYRDPQVVEQRLILEVNDPVAGKVRVPASPWRMSKTPPSVRKLGPVHGEHTYEEILAQLRLE